jgi:hypothetical protein
MVEVMIKLSDEDAARIREAAARAGLSLEDYLVRLATEQQLKPRPGSIEAHVAASERANIGSDKLSKPAKPGTMGALLEAARRANIDETDEPDSPPASDRTWEDDWYDHLTRYHNDQEYEDGQSPG